MYTLCKSIIYLTGFAVFISGCASTARIKTSRTDIEKKEEIVHAEDIKILPPRKTLNTGEKLVYGITWLGVPVGTIKRHATGKGNADKEAMVVAARARGFSPADDNEADAIAILHWAIETNGGVA